MKTQSYVSLNIFPITLHSLPSISVRQTKQFRMRANEIREVGDHEKILKGRTNEFFNIVRIQLRREEHDTRDSHAQLTITRLAPVGVGFYFRIYSL